MYEEKTRWVVIESGSSKKMKPLPLTDWDWYEWDIFKILKKDDSIVWFDEKEEAIDFIFKNFNEDYIDEEILPDKKLPKGYSW